MSAFEKQREQFNKMLSGGCGKFTGFELWQILINQTNLGINTISIQQSIDGEYVCRVDEVTVNLFKERNQI